MDQPEIRVTFDEDADAAFVYLSGEIGFGDVARSQWVPIRFQGGSMIVVYDDQGAALGIEFLGCSRQFTAAMLDALRTAADFG